MGCHRDPGGDCHGEWGCHDCPYHTPEAIEKQQMEIFSRACDADYLERKNKPLKKDTNECKSLLNEAVSILKALKYDNKDFYKRVKAALKESNTKKNKKND